ncbi:Hypothetical_protein [Hexamita inflata]|uniref:Hypothetical_protein n=1 Tax=Hexamita inflata TaxID=28002 RepID=A0ABP1HNZ9_9EUKA
MFVTERTGSSSHLIEQRLMYEHILIKCGSVGQLTYKGVPSCKTPLQASDKYHSLKPYKSFKFNISTRYILDTFLLIREMKMVTPLQANKQLPYKQGYVVELRHIKFTTHDIISYIICKL